MDQSEFELQLQVWKDLAISKQVLMGAATDALGLDPDCETDELKTALDAAIKRSMEADANISEAQEQARVAVEVMEQKVKASEQASEEALTARDEAETALKAIEQQIIAARAANAEEVKKAKKQLAEEQKKLKAINVSLGDTPENVVKKMKAMKKQKTDDANAKKRAEDATRAIRKEKQTLEQRLKAIESAIKESAEMVEKYRECHEACTTMHGLLKDSDDRPELPVLNDKLLEGIEEAAKSLDEK
ncbi:MAG: hypothetical protein OQL16_13295 [Gammaproteobacteria bacterium]|nr:hypothetical protein [Gammaproteobacteria bacterium]